MGEEGHITVHIKYGEHEQTFTGPVEEVWRAVNKFFSDLLPIFRLMRHATLTVDLVELMKELQGLISFSEGRVVVLADRRRTPDRDVIMLALVGAYIGYRLGSLPKDSLSSAEIRQILEKTSKITSTRLSELKRQGWVERTEDGEYRATPLGILRFREKRLPMITPRPGKKARR